MNPQRTPTILIEDLPVAEELSAEEIANLFGAGFLKTTSLRLESLEMRDLMASNLASSLVRVPMGPALVAFPQTPSVPLVSSAPAAQLATRAAPAANSILSSKVVPFDLTTRGSLTFNLGTGAYHAKVEVTNGVSYDTDKIRELLSGNVTLPSINPLQAAAAFYGLQTNHTSNYNAVRQSLYSQHGAENVYFVSERFSEYASPETVGAELAKSIATAGSSTASSVKEAFNQIKLELNDIYSWAKVKGNALASTIVANALEAILLQKSFDSPELSVKWFNINHTYRVNVGAFGVGGSAAINSPHLGFAIIWKTQPGSLARALTNFSSLSQSNPQAVQQLLTQFTSLPAFQSNPTLKKFLQLANSNPGDRIDAVIASRLKAALGLDVQLLRQRYTAGNPVINLTGTAVATRLASLLSKFTIGNEGSVRVNKLEFNLGTLAFNIDVSLRHRHSWGSLADMAKELANRFHMGVDSIGREMAKLGRSAQDVAQALGGITRDVNAIAGVLRNRLGASYDTIATALYRGISWTTANNVASGLGSLTRDAKVIASALRNRLGLSFDAVADAMYRGIGWTRYRDVARGLSGLTTNVQTIANTLRNKLGASLSSVGDALYYGISATNYRSVAKALGGLTTNVSTVGGILRNTLGASYNTVADALYYGIQRTNYRDVARALDTLTTNIETIAGALRSQLGASYNSIADALYNGIQRTNYRDVARGLGSLTRDADTIAGALRNQLGASYNTVADALYRGIQWTTYRDVASGLGSLTRNIETISGVLKNQLGASIGTIADALWNGIDWTEHAQVAQGLGSITRNVGDIAAALRNQVGASYKTIAKVMYQNIQWTTEVDVANGLKRLTTNAGTIANALRQGAGIAESVIRNTITSIQSGLSGVQDFLGSVSSGGWDWSWTPPW